MPKNKKEDFLPSVDIDKYKRDLANALRDLGDIISPHTVHKEDPMIFDPKVEGAYREWTPFIMKRKLKVHKI